MKIISILVSLCLFTGCATTTFKDRVKIGREQCYYIIEKLDMDLKESKWDKRAYLDCVSNMTAAHENFEQVGALKSIAMSLAFIMGSMWSLERILEK